jgi:hypothetical protein
MITVVGHIVRPRKETDPVFDDPGPYTGSFRYQREGNAGPMSDDMVKSEAYPAWAYVFFLKTRSPEPEGLVDAYEGARSNDGSVRGELGG